ncbi:MAG: 3-deoxy-D-manno-octulosonic acid transferase [Gemmatimonadales bacterium]
MLKLLYRAAWNVMRAAAPIASLGDRKAARAITGRLGAAGALAEWARLHRDTKMPLVWFHAASVGEGRQAEAVMARLRAARPDWQVVFTHASASAEQLAAAIGADFAGYVPADTRRDTAVALDALHPRALVFAATDLWPELVLQAAARNVRIGLISATLAPTSSRRSMLARALLGPTYRALDAVGAIDEADARALERLGVRPERIRITGDTRHDAALARAVAIDRGRPALRALRESRAPLLVAGSTWPADERVLLPAVALTRAKTPLALVIAPHEPDEEHLAALERRIALSLPGAVVVRLSALESQFSIDAAASRPPPAASQFDVCVVDRVGVLADLYSAATIAFVGGGFHAAGLHAVIEPAALGVPVLFGPQWNSSRDARLLLEHSGGASASDARSLSDALTRWLENQTARAAAGAAARAVVDTGLGAAERSLELVLNL